MATIHKNLSTYDKNTIPNAKNFRFGIVVSEWNPKITEGLKKGAIYTLLENGVSEENITVWDVPGTFELPFGCKTMIQKLDVDAVISIGSVIQGETKHFDFKINKQKYFVMVIELRSGCTKFTLDWRKGK